MGWQIVKFTFKYMYYDYLSQDIAALLQEGHGGTANAGGQLHSQQLLLLRVVLWYSMQQCNRRKPIGQGVTTEQTATQ